MYNQCINWGRYERRTVGSLVQHFVCENCRFQQHVQKQKANLKALLIIVLKQNSRKYCFTVGLNLLTVLTMVYLV